MLDFDKAIGIDPRDWAFFFERGRTWSEQGQLDRAIADFDEAIRLNPKAEDGYILRGRAHLDRRELDHAISDFDDAIRLKPKHAFHTDSRRMLRLKRRNGQGG